MIKARIKNAKIMLTYGGGSIKKNGVYNQVTDALNGFEIFDMLGRKVETLMNREQDAGNYSITFDASKLSSGIYFYSLSSGSFVQTKKIIVLK